jgi:hypothetical protein
MKTIEQVKEFCKKLLKDHKEIHDLFGTGKFEETSWHNCIAQVLYFIDSEDEE